jgi:hypothetical protein
MKRIKKRAALTRPLLIPLIIFLSLLQLASFWQQEYPGSSIWWLVATAPLIPAGFLVFGIIAVLNKLDELERKILINATALGGLVMFFLLIYLGMMEMVGVAIPNPIYYALFMIVLILVAKLLGNRSHK